MEEIKILGTGCPKCHQLEKLSRKAAEELGIEHSVEKVKDINKILEYGVMTTPALVINGDVKIAGNVPSLEEIKKLIKQTGSRYILILLGSFGTGKTSLIKYILKEWVNLKQQDIDVIYAKDDKILKHDQIWVDIINCEIDILILDDLDKSISPRGVISEDSESFISNGTT